MKKEMIKDVSGAYFIFEVLYKDDTEYALDFTVNEVTSWNLDNTPSEVEKYLRGIIKWDGCSHIHFGDKDGYIHLCGKRFFDNHIYLMEKLFELASKTIKNFDYECANS